MGLVGDEKGMTEDFAGLIMIRELKSKKDGLLSSREETNRARDDASKAYNEFYEAASAIIDEGRVLDGLIFDKARQSEYSTAFDWLAKSPPEGSHAGVLLRELFNALDALDHKGERVRSLHLNLREDDENSTGVSTSGNFSEIAIFRDDSDVFNITEIRLSQPIFGDKYISLHEVLSLKRYCKRYGFKIDPNALLAPYAEAVRYLNRFYPEEDKDSDYREQKRIIDRYPVILGFLAMADVLTDAPDNVIEMCQELANKPYGKKKEEETEDE